ncbi:MAG: alpha/beta hydrolase [Anaerolineae bacterium]|nr:alpha/beta hydrolase [Anaerolineae bacterium]
MIKKPPTHTPFTFLLITLLLGAAILACAGPVAPSPTPPLPNPQPGVVEVVPGAHGSHVRYVPTALTSPPPLVVLAHGTPGDGETAQAAARYYVENWKAWAETHGAILIAPAFDQANFGSKEVDMTHGGYRGLFGRQVGADAWVIELVDAYAARYDLTNRRFYLYGHSAGGQFAARFLVTHPERLHGAVISAPVTYPHPDPDIAWPFGLAPFDGTLQWTDPPGETPARVEPDPTTWLAGVQVPAVVVVGLNDLEPQLAWPGQRPTNRVTIARDWVAEMEAWASAHGIESRIELSMIPGLGHSAYGLLPHCQQAMATLLEK